MKKKILTDQVTGFQSLARDLGCIETEAGFDAGLGKIARAAVPRKAAKRVRTEIASPAPSEPAAAPPKKKIKFGLPGA